MSAKKGGFKELLFSTIMPKVYGIGAAVVIVGAMFKILHLPGASEMLTIGLTVEAIIFFLSAFEPQHAEIVVDTNILSIDKSVEKIVKFIKKNYIK